VARSCCVSLAESAVLIGVGRVAAVRAWRRGVACVAFPGQRLAGTQHLLGRVLRSRVVLTCRNNRGNTRNTDVQATVGSLESSVVGQAAQVDAGDLVFDAEERGDVLGSDALGVFGDELDDLGGFSPRFAVNRIWAALRAASPRSAPSIAQSAPSKMTAYSASGMSRPVSFNTPPVRTVGGR
jgi:hypothetical protein